MSDASRSSAAHSSGGVRLSIAIPTYNGARTLRETLDSIVPQLTEGVDILISDNASTDTTAEIVREYQSRVAAIRYVRNDENVGPDRNFDLAIRRSAGDFVWLFSDDDCLEPGAVACVLGVLNTHPSVATIFVNWASWNEDLSQVKVPRALDLSGDVLCADHNQYIAAVKLYPLLASSNVVRRELWTHSESSRYVGTYWIHYLTILSMLPGWSAYCVATPYVKFRSGLLGWKSNYVARLHNSISLSKGLMELRDRGYRRELLSELGRIGISDLPQIIVAAKFQGIPLRYSLDTIACFSRYRKFWLLGFPLLIMPGFVFRAIGRKRIETLARALKARYSRGAK